MNVSNREMRDLLAKWAEYYAYDEDSIGYPPRNILDKLRKEGASITSSNDANYRFKKDAPEDAQEIERLFILLKKENEYRFTVIRYKFLANQMFGQESVVNTIMARNLKISIRTLQDHIKKGVEWFEMNYKKKVIEYKKAA